MEKRTYSVTAYYQNNTNLDLLEKIIGDSWKYNGEKNQST